MGYANRWVWSQKSRYYTTRGEEIESEDALNRYTAALYGYKENLPIAVGKNTRHIEMNYDGFEDYYINSSDNPSNCADPCPLYENSEFNIKKIIKEAALNTIVIDNTKSHTGKSSLKLINTQLSLSAPIFALTADFVSAV